MINGKRVIAVIPARGGSKGIPNKNIAPLGGKPLLAWPILVAQASAMIDRIIVSTDSDTIADTARAYGAEVYARPEALATDAALVIEAIRHLRDQLIAEGEEPFYFVLLETTSPFRTPQDIEQCLLRLEQDGLDSIASFSPAHLNPHRAWAIEDGMPRPFVEGAVPWMPRQQLPPAWQLTGTVYAFNAMALPADTISILYGRLGAHMVDGNASIDIDSPTDLRFANAVFDTSCLAAPE